MKHPRKYNWKQWLKYPHKINMHLWQISEPVCFISRHIYERYSFEAVISSFPAGTLRGRKMTGDRWWERKAGSLWRWWQRPLCFCAADLDCLCLCRLFADILNDFAIFLEILAPGFPAYFTAIVCVAGVSKVGSTSSIFSAGRYVPVV